jgi:Uma2 family endonuclease
MELIDGSLVMPGPRTHRLDEALFVIPTALRRGIPDDLRVRREMTVTLGLRQRPEPDIIVIRAQGTRDLNQTTYEPGDVVLAIEVVSLESQERDRNRKPQLYAEAGIPYFWLVEEEDGETVLHTYELGKPTDAYIPTGIHHGIAKLDVPYSIEIDFGEIDRL